jgi:protein-arginine kinase activator protein McsA
MMAIAYQFIKRESATIKCKRCEIRPGMIHFYMINGDKIICANCRTNYREGGYSERITNDDFSFKENHERV